MKIFLFILGSLFCCQRIAEQDFIYVNYADAYPANFSENTKIDEVQALGKKLGENIDQIYIRSNLDGMSIAEGSRIINKLLNFYIKEGDSFSYAEKLLKSAEMGVITDPTHVPHREDVYHGFLLAKKIIAKHWIGYTGVGIYLHPAIEGDFSAIGKINVHMYRTFP